MNTNTNTAFLMTTAAPTAVHQCEVISVIAEELYACFALGFGYASGVRVECTAEEGCDVGTNEGLSRADIAWSRVEEKPHDLSESVAEPRVVDTIAEAALASVKDWASDVNAFYNSDLLKQMVSKLCNDYFQIGMLAQHDTFTSFHLDITRAFDEAMKACSAVVRS